MGPKTSPESTPEAAAEPGGERVFEPRVAYWPSRSGIFWWEDFRRDEVDRDFDLSAEHGLRCLAISLVWSDFQPEIDRISLTAMRSLERVLDMAADRGIALVPVLFPVRLVSVVAVPGWTLDLLGEPGQRVLSGHTFSRRPIRDLFRDERMLESQLLQIREVIGAFADHPAVREWLLGDRVTAGVSPNSRVVYEEWLGMMTETARAAGARQPLRHGLSAADLVRSAEVDLHAIGRLGVGIQVADDWEPRWATGAASWWPAFLAAYATRLSGRAAIVSEVGLRGGRAQGGHVGSASSDHTGCVDEVARAISLMREVGGGGCVAPFLLDFVDALRHSPPFAEEPRALRSGLFRIDGTPRQIAALWSDLAQRRDPVTAAPETLPDPDAELRARDPEGIAREFFAALTR